jgi:hypothetical protein
VLPWVILGAAVVAAIAGWLAFSRPRLSIANRLSLPVQLHVDNAGDWTLAPGASMNLKAPRSGIVALRWEAVRPMVGAFPVGERLNGSATVTKPARGTRLTIGAAGSGFAYFAPLITNASTQPLRIVVNAGLAEAYDCACQVPPGAVRMPIGYYRLYANSTVQAIDPAGRTAQFRNIAASASPPANTIGLRFTDADLRQLPR